MPKIIHKTWWILTVKGIITFLFGIIALLAPISSIFIFVSVFSALLLVSGLTLLIISFSEKYKNDRSWKLTEGFIDVMMGIIMLVFPEISLNIFIALISIWISFVGILQILNGYRLRSLFNHWWVLALNGVMAIVFAILIFTYPVHGLVTLVVLIGLQAMVFGGFLIISSLYLKKLIKDISIEIPHLSGDDANQELSYY